MFPEPWWDLRGTGFREGEQREGLVRRLLTEIGRDHALATRSIEAVAAFTRQDEVLYRIDNGQEFFDRSPRPVLDPESLRTTIPLPQLWLEVGMPDAAWAPTGQARWVCRRFGRRGDAPSARMLRP